MLLVRASGMGWQRFLLVVWLLGIWLALAGTVVASADGPFVLQQFRVPLGGDLGGLEALLVRPSEPGRYPLTLIAHGSPRPGLERPNITPLSMLPQALEFVRRGWAAVIVMRRGYGSSDGAWAETFGTCDNPNYIASGLAGAADLKMTLEFLSHRPDLDPTRMISPPLLLPIRRPVSSPPSVLPVGADRSKTITSAGRTG
jgi:hypothetical protein